MEIKKAAVESDAGVKKLKEDWTDEKTKEILTRARDSEKKDPDLGRSREYVSLFDGDGMED